MSRQHWRCQTTVPFWNPHCPRNGLSLGREGKREDMRTDSKPRKLCLKSGCMTGKMKLPAFDLSFSFHIKNLKFHLKIKIRKRLEVCSWLTQQTCNKCNSHLSVTLTSCLLHPFQVSELPIVWNRFLSWCLHRHPNHLLVITLYRITRRALTRSKNRIGNPGNLNSGPTSMCRVHDLFIKSQPCWASVPWSYREHT